ncbi:hypothetical protein [Bordetella genomosp. 13]|uniref:Secreted protein n=1 Tax=Bordetella genomosp. 13 TaxID=463040 RepID=A0A1W6ZDN0_9BORD|nr:hypothetical protein [Bordetella genomosp. 13]ARP95250.1 hypothetical protein CAL15_13160 [Bordetella genomosp. 13]
MQIIVTLRISAILVAAIATPVVASAECAHSAKEVFFCEASKGRVIQVCDAGKTIEYTFGTPKQPDIVLAAERDKVTTRQWSGMGPMAYNVRVPNGGTSYTVFWSSDRDPSHSPDAGVEVEINGKVAATVQCLAKRPIRNGMEDVDLQLAQ